MEKIKKPTAGFIKFVNKQTQNPEMKEMLLKSEQEQARYKIYAGQQRHVLTEEEKDRGMRGIEKSGGINLKDKFTNTQLKQMEISKIQHEKETSEPTYKYSESQYKTLKAKQNIGVSYPITRKLPIKEQYKRTESTIYGIPIVDPVFGITKYGKPHTQEKVYGLPKKVAIKEPAQQIITPTQRLIKPTTDIRTLTGIIPAHTEKVYSTTITPKGSKTVRLSDIHKGQENIYTTILNQPSKPIQRPAIKRPEVKPQGFIGLDSFSGIKSPQRVERKPATKHITIPKRVKKPVAKKFKTIKSYKRRFPLHCKKSKR